MDKFTFADFRESCAACKHIEQKGTEYRTTSCKKHKKSIWSTDTACVYFIQTVFCRNCWHLTDINNEDFSGTCRQSSALHRRSVSEYCHCFIRRLEKK